MTSKLTYLMALTYFFLTSCSTDLALISETQIIDHSTCDSNEPATVLLSANEGNGPYFYEVFDINKDVVFSEVIEDASVLVQIKDLTKVNYTYKITDQNVEVSEGSFQINPIGQSSIKSTVEMYGTNSNGAVYNTEIKLYKEEAGQLVLTDSQITDKNGNYSFDNLDSGDYSVEITLPSKYDEYKMAAFNNEGINLVKAGSNKTEMIALSCIDELDLKVVFRK